MVIYLKLRRKKLGKIGVNKWQRLGQQTLIFRLTTL